MQNISRPRLGWKARFYRYRYWFVSWIAVLLLLIPGTLKAQAQAGYPPFIDPHLNDYGQVIETSDATAIRATLRQFYQQTGVQAVVVTVNSVQNYRTGDRTIESFATNLFNTWGIGDRTRNDGILLLVAPGDRKMRIELGSGYAASYDAVAQSIIDNEILPYFRDGLISRGTVSGVNAIVNRFNPRGAAQPVAGLPPSSMTGPAAQPLQGVPVGGAIALGGTALASAVIFSQWQRQRQRQCPHCRTEMIRLDEQADDAFLNTSQQKEESLQSVDYDVWQCPSCGHHQTLSYGSFFSQYRKCPRCSTRALEVRSTTTRQPTYTHTGEEKITENCRHCSHHDTRYRTIPRRTRSSSSSGGSGGGSGGGGRSSGGGASGSW